MGVAAPASAHTQLVGVDPAEGTTVAADTAVTLTFSGDLLDIGAEATVTDAAGVVTTLAVSFPTASSARVTLPVMARGDLAFAWRVVAGDGHPVEGSLAYVADAPANTAPSSALSPATSPEVTAAPAELDSPDAVTTSEDPAATADDSSGSNNVALWVAIFGAVFVSSAAIIAAKRRS